MRELLNIPFPIIVEGKYDKQKILSVCRANVIATDGFGVFKNRERLCLIKRLAKDIPVIVLTDSDGAGKVIRSHLCSAIPPEKIIQLYIPQIKGKEKRKKAPSAEGTLGVEGMESDLLYDLLSPFEDKDFAARIQENPLSKTDLFVDGLTGGEGSAARRDALAQKIGLPSGMTPNAFLSALRVLCTYEEYLEIKGDNYDRT